MKIKVLFCFTKDKALRKAKELVAAGFDVEIKSVSEKKNPRFGTRPFWVSALRVNKLDLEELDRYIED